MPAYTAPRLCTATASVSVVDTVVLTDPGFGVSVTNDSGTAPLFFTVSHPGGDCPVPSVNGANCFVAASVAGATVNVRHPGQFGSVVQLISAGSPQYTVVVTGNQINA